MWLDEIRFSQFQSGGCKWVRREADEVMKPSGPVPTVQAYGGSVMIWGWFSWSAMLCAQKIRSSTWIYWMTRSSISGLSWSHWKHHWLPMLWYKPWRVYVILVVAFYLWIFFFSHRWWHEHIRRWQCHDSSGSNYRVRHFFGGQAAYKLNTHEKYRAAVRKTS